MGKGFLYRVSDAISTIEVAQLEINYQWAAGENFSPEFRAILQDATATIDQFTTRLRAAVELEALRMEQARIRGTTAATE